MWSLKERDYDQNKYISLDLEKFFRENDEFNMLKTLQEMYVSSYNLELEIKSLVTNELDSVLLCVETILQMCALIKQSKSNLDSISKMVNEFNYDVIFEEACKNKLNVPELELNELKLELNNWMCNYNRGWLENEIYSSGSTLINLSKTSLFRNYEEFVERCKGVNIHIKSLVSDHLHSITMSNYKLLKKNQLLNSYELLFLKVPLLLNLLKELGGLDTSSLSKEAERMCEFCKKKLKSHCLTNLGTHNIEVLLESISVTFLVSGKDIENVNYLLKKRLESYNIATSSLAPGSLGALKQLFSHFFANEAVCHVLSFCGNLECKDNSMFRESYEPKLLDQLTNYSLVKLIQVKQEVSHHISQIQVEFDKCGLTQKLGETREFLTSVFEKTWNKCANHNISNIILSISSSLNGYMKIKTDLDNFSEYFDDNDFFESSKYDTDSLLNELNEFLLTEQSFNQLVESKLDSILEKVNKQFAEREFKHTQPNSLTIHSIQAYNMKFKSWLGENGVLDSLLILNELNPTTNLHKLYEIIANKYLVPLINVASKNIEGIRAGNPSKLDQNNELDENKKEEDSLYMVMVIYAASLFKSYIDELIGYKECVFSKHLRESALVMGIEYYIKNLNTEEAETAVERDAAILSMIYRDKSEESNSGLKDKYRELELKVGNGQKYEGLYLSFKNLM